MKASNLVILILLIYSSSKSAFAQNIEIDVNLNIEHSVDGISDFSRERHINVHSTPTENDWIGEEDKLHYLIQDLDVYFGRDNGSSTWKFKLTPQDASRPAKADLDWMVTEGNRLKTLYETERLAHQYKNKGHMIMGTNPHPLYPTLSWNGDGVTDTGWQPYDVDTSAEWVVQYLDKYFAQNNGDSGEPLPTYWEVVNEIDMLMMTGVMTCTSQEKIWEYHNLVAEGIKQRLGSKAPKIGGMTWGLHDFYKPDGISRYDQNYLDQYLEGDGIAIWHNMMDTEVVSTKNSPWYQWDVMWQGFIDAAGSNMDFYGIHVYDWPKWESPNGSYSFRTGGHTEAMLDILEWYDIYKLGTKKDIVLSEYGAVTGYQQNKPNIDPKRRDWENLKPFNSMLMQFLERPSHVVHTVPFTPIKAEWGDWKDGQGNVTNRYPYTLMDKDSGGNWQWSEFIKFYELWSDVNGTRVDTKSSNIDIQVDSYIDGNHVYLILNNLTRTEQTLNLNLYDDHSSVLENVHLKHLYLDEGRGIAGEPVLTDQMLSTAPGSITIGAEATIILDYKYQTPIPIDQTSVETKFMGERLGTGTNAIGGEMFRVNANSGSYSMNINNIVVPSIGEAVLRLSGKFWVSHMYPSSVKVNGNSITIDNNWRGVEEDNGSNVFFGVMEIPIPIEHLETNNTFEITMPNSAEYATSMLQIWGFSKKPSRFDDSTTQIELQDIALGGDISLMEGLTESLTITFTPENATDKNITWTSSNDAAASVDEFGIVTAHAEGSTTITATSADGNHSDNITVTVTPFSAIAVANISILEGNTIEIPYYITTQLTSSITPLNATEQNVVWSSSDPNIVEVGANTGKITGKVIFGNATITASLTDPNNGNTIHNASIEVNVAPNGVFVETTGVSLNPQSKTLTLNNEQFQLQASILPNDATINTYSWSSDNTDVATVNNFGIVSAISDGTAIITVTTDRGSYTANSEITVATIPTGNTLIIEAENFIDTDGTFNDGHVPLGVNKSSVGVNWVNSGDWITYTFDVSKTAEYEIIYFISTISDNAEISSYIDNTLVSKDQVLNNGAWDSYIPLKAQNTIQLTSGTHALRIEASGTNPWQWNLERIELREVEGLSMNSNVLLKTAKLIPNPASEEVSIFANINDSFNITIYDLRGSLIKDIAINGLPTTLSVDNLPEGVYFIKVYNQKSQKIFKLVKASKL
ncbi:Ig-like domain-containing protein [uncultured Algibacter sp.]|uniref:Ig-like domain-containing protein n=1 Tax=uncultured Algibacter sp. TaxID=298659 RepID=UPI00262BD59A|nr:Ig-like domain-containing protein [uncultured Algibacter sp.]